MFTGLFHFIFASIETSLRLFVRGIDATACNRGAAEFFSIRVWLLKRLGLQKLENYFELLRLIRNTIHNNGVYISRTGTTARVEWMGTQYDFVHGQNMRFVDWDFVLARIAELPEILTEIVEAAPLSAMAGITDPVVPHKV